MVEEGATVTVSPDPSIPRAGQQVFLLDLPYDILLRICTWACTHPSTIRPHLWLPGSSKFGLTPYTTMRGGFQLRGTAGNESDPLYYKALTIYKLGKSCETLRELVDESNLFYQSNTFEFDNFTTLLHYVKALPPRHRHALQNIKILYNTLQDPSPALTMLSSLKHLKHITLDITLLAQYLVGGGIQFTQCPGFFNLIALRGLKNLVLTYGEIRDWNLLEDILSRRQMPISQENGDVVRFEITSLESSLKATMTLPRTTEPTSGELTLATSQPHVREGTEEGGIAIPSSVSTTISGCVFSTIASSTLDEQHNGEANDSAARPQVDFSSPWAPDEEWATDHTPRTWFHVRMPGDNVCNKMIIGIYHLAMNVFSTSTPKWE
ncbi:hypothetical protein BDZ45DRAFT_807113 [Acephala macrosclerotiorum]|nr:hypothetical protein BDZ45DRAFT_807113 [Acephala macrosclerotiorum]